MVSAWLDTLLSIPDCLQDCSAVIQIVCVEILLFAQLGKQNTNLVGDIADGLVCRGLAPVGELTCNGETLLAGTFVALDEVVLGLDEPIELLAQFGLNSSTEGAEAEAMTSVRGGVGVLVGADGECAIPTRARVSASTPEYAHGTKKCLYRCLRGLFLSADFRELLRRMMKIWGIAV